MWEAIKAWKAMDCFNVIAGLASIAGLIVSFITLVIASRVKDELALIVRQKTRQIRLEETLRELTKSQGQLARALGSNRARGLVPTITGSLSSLMSYLEVADEPLRTRVQNAQTHCDAIIGSDLSDQSLNARTINLNEEVTVITSLTGALLRDIAVGRNP